MNSYDFFMYEFICFMNSYMNSGVPTKVPYGPLPPHSPLCPPLHPAEAARCRRKLVVPPIELELHIHLKLFVVDLVELPGGGSLNGE